MKQKSLPGMGRRREARPVRTRSKGIPCAAFIGTARERVRALLKEAGARGATDEEMQRLLRMNPSTQRPRRGELVEAGEVLDSGRTRPTLADVSAAVWIHRDFREGAQ